jgi:hypothetical protein
VRCCIARHHLGVSESLAEPGCENRIAFDDDDDGAHPDERLREDARAAADLDDQIVRGDLGIGDEVGCEPATAEEVLAGCSP